MDRTKVMTDSARPSWVLLSYSFLVLSLPSDEANFKYFLDQSDTTAIMNLVYQKFSTETIWFLYHNQGEGTFNYKNDGAELLFKTWTKALVVHGLLINIFFPNG